MCDEHTLLYIFSGVCQTTVNMEADAVRPGMGLRACVMGQGMQEPPVIHVSMCICMYCMSVYFCLLTEKCVFVLGGRNLKSAAFWGSVNDPSIFKNMFYINSKNVKHSL